MSENYKIDPVFWYGDREVKHCPKHFTIVQDVALTAESYQWILNKLSGRYAIIGGPMIDESNDIFSTFSSTLLLGNIVAFEDPKEAMMFKLTWM